MASRERQAGPPRPAVPCGGTRPRGRDRDAPRAQAEPVPRSRCRRTGGQHPPRRFASGSPHAPMKTTWVSRRPLQRPGLRVAAARRLVDRSRARPRGCGRTAPLARGAETGSGSGTRPADEIMHSVAAAARVAHDDRLDRCTRRRARTSRFVVRPPVRDQAPDPRASELGPERGRPAAQRARFAPAASGHLLEERLPAASRRRKLGRGRGTPAGRARPARAAHLVRRTARRDGRAAGAAGRGHSANHTEGGAVPGAAVMPPRSAAGQRVPQTGAGRSARPRTLSDAHPRCRPTAARLRPASKHVVPARAARALVHQLAQVRAQGSSPPPARSCSRPSAPPPAQAAA